MRRATRSTSSKVSRTYSSPFGIFISCHGLFQTYKSYSYNWIFFTHPRAIHLLAYLMFRIRLFVGSSRKECIIEIIDKYIMDTCIVHYIHQRQIIYTSDHFFTRVTQLSAERMVSSRPKALITGFWTRIPGVFCTEIREPKLWPESG